MDQTNLTFVSIWSNYKELYDTVNKIITSNDSSRKYELDAILKKHKLSFVSLLQNPPQDVNQRDVIKKAMNEGIIIPGSTIFQTLPQQLVEETLLFSDMYNMSEIAALEMLLIAEAQRADFLLWPSGLIAVLLYYDGRHALVLTLKILLQAHFGYTWTLQLSTDIVQLISEYTNDIIKEGLLEKILRCIVEMNWDQEEEKLIRNRALGTARHRYQIKDIYFNTKIVLAECIFCWAAHIKMEQTDTLKLFHHLSQWKSTDTLDESFIALIMAALYSIDGSFLENADSMEDFIQNMPILYDKEFIPNVHHILGTKSQPWKHSGLKGLLQIAWSLTVKQLNEYGNCSTSYLEDDDFLLDLGLENNGLFFLSNEILENSYFYKEEFYIRRIHNFLTGFILLMPLKIKDLRNQADEVARIILAHEQQGIKPPGNLKQHFHLLLCCIEKLYRGDPLELHLAVEYWCPIEGSLSLRTSHRQLSLAKFIRLAGDFLPSILFIQYISMLTSLADSPVTAHYCFSMLKSNSSGPVNLISWDHFFNSLQQYYQSMRQEIPVKEMISYRRAMTRIIKPQELQGLLVMLKLIQVVAEHDVTARMALCDHPIWLPIVKLLGLLSCPVDIILKSQLLITLSAFAKSPELSQSIWQNLEAAQILQTLSPVSPFQKGGIQVELEEIEARNEEFPLTSAFIQLLSVLAENPLPYSLGIGHRAPGLDCYIEFVRDDVFLKFNTRSYRNSGDKVSQNLDKMLLCLKLLSGRFVAAV